MRRRQRPRHARRGHDHGEREQRQAASRASRSTRRWRSARRSAARSARGDTSDVANCITWATRQGREGHLDEPRRRRVDDAAERGRLRLGVAHDVLIVAAAGNDGDATLNYPAAYAEVVSVAATDNRDPRASFSNANSDVEIAAPGVNMLSSYNGRRLPRAVGHLDGHAARLGRRGDHPRPQPDVHAPPRPARSSTPRSTTRARPGGTRVRLRPREPRQGRHVKLLPTPTHAAARAPVRYSRRPRLCSTAASRRPSPRSGRSVAVTWRQ